MRRHCGGLPWVGAAVAGALLVSAVGCGERPPAQPAEPLVGAWKLVSIEEFDAEGNQVVPMDYGPEPIGMLMYAAAGNMSAQAMRRDRPKLASDDVHLADPEQAKAALTGYNAYFGTYTIDPAEGIVTHHVEGAMIPNWEGSQQRRKFTISGDTLVLEPPTFEAAGQQRTRRLTWERVKKADGGPGEGR
jgi:hypothetical protein